MSTEPEPQTLTPNPQQGSESNSEPKSESDSEEDDKVSESSESEYSTDSEEEYEEGYDYAAAVAKAQAEEEEKKKTDRTIRPETPEKNRRLFEELVKSGKLKTIIEEEEEVGKPVSMEELYNFPKDPENWREEDLREVWADRPVGMTDTGYDPIWAQDQDRMLAEEFRKLGMDPPVRHFYVPYRKPYPVVPDNHHDIATPKAAVEELDRTEEFLKWVSYIFPDGSSYEGTVWDDVAQGKGVYLDEFGLVRYEGEWLRNEREGHGVVEVDIPDDEPIPDSQEEEKMRAAGKVITADYMSPEDREWLKMDVEDGFNLVDGLFDLGNLDRDDSVGNFDEDYSDIGFPGIRYPEKSSSGKRLTGGTYSGEVSSRISKVNRGYLEEGTFLPKTDNFIPWYEREEWITYFGTKPEKGRYRYAGQFKHGRMHGCGQYDVNERTVYGRFYFGHLLEHPYGCEDEIAAMHAAIAEVAAAKARMFVNKPDGMVREMKGPYSDPQHPYFYEEEDVWMAPGFINQFYEVPDFWKTYVHEVDKERQMWLNSFYKAPLRMPMPSELQYWWEKDVTPEFLLLDTDPKPDPDDPTKEVIEPLVLHTPTGRFIDYTMDDEHGVRLYWVPEDGVVDPDNVEYLPLTQGDVGPKKETFLTRFYSTLEKKRDSFSEKFKKWFEERKQLAEAKLELAEKELELVEAELCLEELLALVDDDGTGTEVKGERKESDGDGDGDGEEEEEEGGGGEEDSGSSPALVSSSENQDEKPVVEEGNDDGGGGGGDDEEEEEEDGDAPSSFGSANTDQNGGKSGPSPFSASSLSFATSSIASGIPALLQRSFLSWKNSRSTPKLALPSRPKYPIDFVPRVDSVTFTKSLGPERKKLIIANSQSLELRAQNKHSKGKVYRLQSLSSLKKQKPNINKKPELPRNQGWLAVGPENELDYILSLHTQVDHLELIDLTKYS